MDNIFKETGEAFTTYAMSATKQVAELNSKLFHDYVEMNRNIMAKIPGIGAFYNTSTKK